MRKIKQLLVLGLTVISIISLTSCRLVAWWIDNRTYTVHFNANGGMGEMEDFLVEEGQEGYLPACQFTKDGYECLAWSTDPEGTDFIGSIPNLSFRLPLSVMNGDTIEVYAVWTTPGFTFEISTMGYLCSASITSYSGTATDIIVPAWYDGPDFEYDAGYASCHVGTLSSGLFQGHTEIETIKNMPADSIGSKLFYGCTSLKSIELAKDTQIDLIGAQAFYNCTALQGIELDGRLETIGSEAFYQCTSINKLVIPRYISKIGADAFYGWTEDQTIEFVGHSKNIFGEEWLNGCNANIIWSGDPDNNKETTP